ncbi:TadE/TadG family type IV pilus assembly protein [Kitasatospora sp. GAS204B]|uniref:TadE/TadG family type IV pilus assembly protein n=1 Tax=unclassified Kitasatospora TaxID=2633591 RepID=UPI0024769D8A|nr:TadE/TadG family type IV pilus assembly protein [Kitasatospora sp. GAS204B]MDH6122716.1 Flp pilus assembly protein TadG [Kitasatospora sp. GAS204B]
MRPLMRRHRDRGSLSLEAAILAPVLLLAILLIVAAGRSHLAGNVVDDAAREAARAASLERDGITARNEGSRVAQQTLQDQGLKCVSLSVDVPTGGFAAAIGTPASVKVTVSCTVDLSDLTIPGVPGSTTVTGTFTSPIDPYRGRVTSP